MKRIPTGVEGLDKMLGGGLPAERSFLICGGPGSGKTILCMQFLYHGAIECKEPGLYVSLDENKDNLREEMAGFGWDIDKLEKSGQFLFVDACPIRNVPGEVKLGGLSIGKRDFNLMSLIEIIWRKAEKAEIKRVVIDPIAGLTFQYPDVSERRTATLDFLEALAQLKTTNLITTELRSLTLQRDILAEEFLTQGVIVLHSWRNQLAAHGGLQIEKMRGIAHDNQIRPYKITKKGFQVFSEEQPLVDIDTMVSVSQRQS
ncbi:MAG: ATPase domain-containing protein [Candidatus Bathyarchaeia archaeon]|jgi:circadian clock protein KaiC